MGQRYITNPDLVERIASGAPLAEIDWAKYMHRVQRVVLSIRRVRFEDGRLAEHRDVLHEQATTAQSGSGLPMFGDRFPS